MADGAASVGPPRKKCPGLSNISARPAAVNDRLELGHWEGDQIIGQGNRSSMLWLTERVACHSIGITMPEGYAGEAMLAGLAEGLDQIPSHQLRSITVDQACADHAASIINGQRRRHLGYESPAARYGAATVQ